MSRVLVTLIHGFFEKQQHAAIAPNRLTMKLSKFLCIEPKVIVCVTIESNVPPVLYS